MGNVVAVLGMKQGAIGNGARKIGANTTTHPVLRAVPSNHACLRVKPRLISNIKFVALARG